MCVCVCVCGVLTGSATGSSVVVSVLAVLLVMVVLLSGCGLDSSPIVLWERGERKYHRKHFFSIEFIQQYRSPLEVFQREDRVKSPDHSHSTRAHHQ